jgi:hypothetical protein
MKKKRGEKKQLCGMRETRSGGRKEKEKKNIPRVTFEFGNV